MTSKLILSGAGIVLPDRLLPSGSLVIEGARIVDISDRPRAREQRRRERVRAAGETYLDLTGHLIVPGFIDVHIHGVEGHDGLAAASGVAEMARRLPRYGVTGFCPTTIACGPDQLAMILAAIRNAQRDVVPGASRVLQGASRKQFHQPRLSRRAADRLHPPSARGAAASKISKRRSKTASAAPTSWR